MSAGHELVFGQTGAGKSCYLKYVVIPRAASVGRRNIIIFDPFGDEWPGGCFVTDDEDIFYRRVWHSDNALVIHDEAGYRGKYNARLDDLAVRGRHNGHICFFAAQRPQYISTTVRGQCDRVTTFGLVPKDAKFLSEEEFGQEQLLLAAKLRPLVYLKCDRWGNISKGKVTIPSEMPSIYSDEISKL